MTAIRDRLAWFNAARFGMMITWGLHSLLGSDRALNVRVGTNRRTFVSGLPA